MQNPFQYGRELGPGELADREDEVREVRDALLGGGKLFLVGPRRFGKTSVHNVAAQYARDLDGIVLRYNVEAFTAVDGLLAAIVADAGALVPGPLERAGRALEKLFRALRPTITYNATSHSLAASLGVAPTGSPVPRLVEVLDGLEAAAKLGRRPVGLVLDEVQHLVADGIGAEQQLRAAVQTHRRLGYVFAGSDTRLLGAMTTDPTRPFYRLGTVRFLDEIPRPAFLAFLKKGFAKLPGRTEAAALVAMLDEAEDVPYNVQLLAHHCWNHLRDAGARGVLTPARVHAIHLESARRLDPLFSQTWTALPVSQRKALHAIASRGGDGLFAQETLARYRVSAAAMQKARDALVDKRLCWQQVRAGVARLRLEDPMFGLWVRELVAGV